eukprot:1152453-Pelagomonas_calceolata.AAC.6
MVNGRLEVEWLPFKLDWGTPPPKLGNALCQLGYAHSAKEPPLALPSFDLGEARQGPKGWLRPAQERKRNSITCHPVQGVPTNNFVGELSELSREPLEPLQGP